MILLISIIWWFIKNIVLWALTLCCAALAFGCFPSLCSIMAIVAVIFLLPLEGWQKLLDGMLPRWLRFLLVIALCVGIVYTAPTVHTHDFAPADCTAPKTCKICKETEGDPLSHTYADGKCVKCDSDDLSYKGGVRVWIPTKGGDMYHIESTCSQMIDPKLVTVSDAQAQGFTPCSKCYP